ncbi:hypothetical protein P154DRAFT_539496 [Amniculicola lignicola CBS 123094]|uniref:DUF4470 domain-containing protein n=1 Tax=Amniculicola lignicola CBS 123094 TaxID=1392246 RepID=A0A6A5W309_9PLEO|nr:hypothetical protein P154DRAFT_539496 [Amniculicola lignicola CBS 123094]
MDSEVPLLAVKAARKDSRPLANLSAVYFELGKYGEAEGIEWSSKGHENQYWKRMWVLIEERGGSFGQLPRGLGYLSTDEEIYKQTNLTETISILFGGFGDARHFFATLLIPKTTKAVRGQQKLHITCTDHKPMVFARFLVALLVPSDLGEAQDSPPPEMATDDVEMLVQHNTSLLLYLHFAVVMPPIVFGLFQLYLKKAITFLEDTKSLKDKNLYVSVVAAHSTTKVEMGPILLRKRMVEEDIWDGIPVPPGLGTERSLWGNTG